MKETGPILSKILEYFSVDWNSLVNNDKDVNLSFNNF